MRPVAALLVVDGDRVRTERRGGYLELPCTDGESPAPLLAALGLAGPAPFAGVWTDAEHEPTPRRVSLFLTAGPAETAAAEALEGWRRFEHLLSPMMRHVLESVAASPRGIDRRLASTPEALGRPSERCEVVPDILQLPLRSPTLPPARHTNAYVIGAERVIVVDPAPYTHEERARLVEALRGRTLDRIVLTHHHVDHMGAAAWLAERTGAPIAAHPITRALLEDRVPVTETLEEGARIELGRDSAGRPFALEVLFTPGHAPGHIVLADRRPGGTALVAGDMAAALGTIIIDPPQGDMAEYIAQLRRLAALPPGPLFAAHGPPIADGRAKLAEYIAHRLAREEKVRRALAAHAGDARPEDLLAAAYADTPIALYPLARRSCLAHLLKLTLEGRAHRSGERFRAA